MGVVFAFKLRGRPSLLGVLALLALLLALAWPTIFGGLEASPQPVGGYGGVLGEGDYGVYIGWFPVFYSPGDQEAHYDVKASWLAGGDANVGPLLLEWMVVRDYGRFSVVYLHVYFRSVSFEPSPFVGQEPSPPFIGVGGSGEDGGPATPFIVFNSTNMMAIVKPRDPYSLVEVDEEFLVVVDELLGYIVDSRLEPLASWLYTLPLAGFEEAWEPSYYVSGVWNLSLPSVRVIDNAYVYSAPRGEVLGPYAVVRVSWVKASLSEVASGKVSLHPLLRELALDFEKSLAGPGRLDISFRVAQAYYDLASGIALAYGALVDPAVYIAKGGLEDSLSPYSINALIGGMGDYHQANETIRSILRDLADGQGYVVDSAYVYLYDASMRQLEFKVARKTGVNRLDMMLSDMALSRSKILGGGVEWNGTQFIGGWNWTLVNSLLGGGSAAVPEAGPNTTGADEVATAPGGSPWLLALTVAGILLGSLLLLARARGRR